MFASSRELSPRPEFRHQHYPPPPSYSNVPDPYLPENTPSNPMVLPGSIYSGNSQNTPEYDVSSFAEHFPLSGKRSLNTEHFPPSVPPIGSASAWQNFSAYGTPLSSSTYPLNSYAMTSLSANYGRVGNDSCKHGLQHCSVCVYEGYIPPLNSI